MLKFLIEVFKASKGRMPNNMEMILLKQKAAKQSIDERKVVSMFDRSAVNPNKPILGGKNIPETEDDIRRRLMKQNEEGLASMKSKLEDPEKKAMGGRIGYAGGSDMGTVADSKGNVGPSKGGYQGGGTGPVERPTGGGGNDNNNDTTYDYTIPKQIVKQTAINTVKNLGRREIMNTLGLAKFSNPIGIAMALKNFYDQTQNPTLTEEEATGGGITGMATGGRANFVGGGITNLALRLARGFMKVTGRKPNPDELQKIIFEAAEKDMNNAIDSATISIKGGSIKAIGRRMNEIDQEKLMRTID